MRPRVRLTKFSAGGSNQVRVFARKNSVISTQQFMEQSCKGEVFGLKDRDSDFDPPANDWLCGYMRQNIEPDYDEKDAELAVTTKLYDFPLNKSIRQLHFFPTTSQNEIDCMPDVQRKLLPYLAEKQARENVYNPDVTLTGMTYADGEGGDVLVNLDEPYLYDGRVMGGYFFQADQTPVAFADGDEKISEPDDIFRDLRPERQGDLAINPGADDGLRTFRFSLQKNDLRADQVRRTYHPVAKYNAAVGLNVDARTVTENKAIGFQGVWLYRVKKKFGNVYRDVYRTEFQDMVFRSRASPLLGAGFTREALFYLPFNLEIGPFDKFGMANLRAVDYDGFDITESVTHPSGFLKMQLWNRQENALFQRPVHGGNPLDLAAANANLQQVNLYLPIRRFTKGKFANGGTLFCPVVKAFTDAIGTSSLVFEGDTLSGTELRHQYDHLKMDKIRTLP